MFRNLTSPKVRPEHSIVVSVATDDGFAAPAVKDPISWDKQNGPQKNGVPHQQQSISVNKHQKPIQQKPNCTQHNRVETCRQQPTTRKVCKKRPLNCSLCALSGALATLWHTLHPQHADWQVIWLGFGIGIHCHHRLFYRSQHHIGRNA